MLTRRRQCRSLIVSTKFDVQPGPRWTPNGVDMWSIFTAVSQVDLVLQLGTRHVGFEINAASSIGERDFRGLKRMREILGSRFHSGLVLYDGDHLLPFGDRLLAVLLSALWISR